jgi:hypothetical protein
VTALASSTRHVIGLDLSPIAIQAAEERLNSLSEDGRPPAGSAIFVCGSFFDLPSDKESKFQFIYDYTFMCALDPSLRLDWAKKMADLVAPGGELLTLIFPICDKEDGPPFKVSLEVYRELLEPVGFMCKSLGMLSSDMCHPGRDGTGQFNAESGAGRWVRR